MPNYNFGRSKFKTLVWIKGGDLFDSFDYLEVEQTTGGTFRLEFVGNGNTVLASQTSPSHTGWHTFQYSNFHFKHLPHEKGKLRFVSNGGEIDLRGGNVKDYVGVV